jgi:hypothetical protein
VITQSSTLRLIRQRSLLAAALLIFLLPLAAQADEVPVEIDYLLAAIGSSDCTFIRNGSRYDAEDAEAHLRMKYKRGKRYASTTENFIERLASKSSMSRKPYFIECGSTEKVESGIWLEQRLEEFRARANVQ